MIRTELNKVAEGICALPNETGANCCGDCRRNPAISPAAWSPVPDIHPPKSRNGNCAWHLPVIRRSA